jgi:hypothetical protein
MDRAGLNITTFLATTVLQTEAKVSKLPTWLDFFFNVSTPLFHAARYNWHDTD